MNETEPIMELVVIGLTILIGLSILTLMEQVVSDTCLNAPLMT